ncbi:MAG TPA: hypothetical protein VKU82_02215 [Planctomycetaceae bacterium]|nr:hypothetical protein [Planctomycetaceae bacterium]
MNRKGEAYYLQSGRTKTGKPRYYLARKITGEPLERVPEGYEIRELPETAVVVLRKAKPTRILEGERKLVEESARKKSGISHLIVDVEEQALVIYAPGMSSEVAGALSPFLGAFGAMQEVMDRLIAHSIFSPMLRFELYVYNEKERLFLAERWCCLGSVDEWIPLDQFAGPLPLADQIDKYAAHLGKESFFELM